MKLKGLTPILLIAVGAGVAWFLLGKPHSFAEVQAKIGGLLHSSKANFAGRGFGGGPSHFAGGWAGAVGNPGFVHGHDRPFVGDFHGGGFHGGGFDHDHFHGFPYGGFGGYPPGVFGTGYPGFPGAPGPWYNNPFDRRLAPFGRFHDGVWGGHRGGFHGFDHHHRHF
jgi:hypothetical protein